VTADNRVGPPSFGSERDMLRGFLDYHRASTRAEAFAAWEAEVGNSRRIEREAGSLDLAGHQPRGDEDVSLRMVMVHVLLEYGRHNGHADLLREGIDGTVGA
jgi:uncharacterized protein DUF664